jgi:CPA1 family monovalent cation:H+ antiporter
MRNFEIILGLLFCATLVAPLARRLDVPLAIAQVVCGLVLSVLPFVPAVEFDPDLVFVLLVPPLLYRAAASNSLRDIRRQAEPILLLAVGLVLLTTATVALVAHAVVPGLPWAAAFVLGAVVSPPDADVTTSIARRLGLPARLVTILEGETLLNDATSFTTYRLAVRAVMVGTFSLLVAAGTFLTLVLGGIGIGLAVGWIAGQIRRRLGDSIGDSVVSILTPFASYLIAERVGGSGVLAVACTGFLVSRFLPRVVAVPSRVRAVSLWETLGFVIAGFIFLLLGLQLGHAAGAFWRDHSLLRITALVTATVIATRFAWILPATWLDALRRRHRPEVRGRRTWRGLAILSWAGLRGGDTLVMVLALPVATAAAAPFPYRSMIATVALGVILATIVLQGLTLRPLIRVLGIPRDMMVDAEERQARLEAERAALAQLAVVVERDRLPDTVRSYIDATIRQRTRLDIDDIDHVAGHDGLSEPDIIRRTDQEVRDAARQAVIRLRDDEVIGDAALTRVLGDLDLDDLRVAPAGAI